MRLFMKYREWKLRRHVKKFGHKNKGYFNYFNKGWFSKHQNILIWLLNHWLLKYWFRWILRIQKDLPFKSKINFILPHAYWFDARYINNGKSIEVKTDFRTHQKFSKRIYYAFRPLWWTLHILDWLIQKTVAPEFSFGFDTLTVYPDANPETTTMDGTANATSTISFSDIRSLSSANGAVYDSASSSTIIQSTGLFADTWYMARGWFLFETSIIGSSGIINSAVFSYHQGTKVDNTGASLIIVNSTPASNTSLVADDYDQVGAVDFGSIDVTSSINNQYNDITLNTNGLTNISKTGVSKFASRSSDDLNNTEPGASQETSVTISMADAAGITQDPKLVVTYTLPMLPFMDVQNIMTQIRM